MNKPEEKSEIMMKPNVKAEAMKHAPDEVIAKAIHDVLLREHLKKEVGGVSYGIDSDK